MFGAGIATLVFVTTITRGRRAPSRMVTTDAHLFFSAQFSYVFLLSWFGNLEIFGARTATLVFVILGSILAVACFVTPSF
jgi:hypothetical protein